MPNTLICDVNFIFCAKGLINVHGFFLQSGDILQVEGQIKSEILSASKATYIAIKLEDVRS